MASLGMFGGGAPRIRRLQPMGNQFAPSIEDMWSQTQAQLQAGQAAQADMMQRVRNSSGPSNSVPRPGGAFGRGPQGQPAPAPVSEQPPQLPPSDPRTGISGAAYRGALGAFMRGPERPASQQPAPTQAPAPIVQGGQAMTRDQANAAGRTQKPGGFLEMFGYDREGTGMEPLEWIFSDRTDVQNAKAEIAARQAAEASAQRDAEIQRLMMSNNPQDRMRLAYLVGDSKLGENLATNFAAANVGAGDSRVSGFGDVYTAPKFGVDGGYGYSQTPEGIEWQEQRGRNYAEDTDAATLDETKRNNDMANSRGWGQIGVDRDRLAFEKTKADNENGGLGKLTPMQQAVDKNWADDLVSWETNGRADFVNNMALLNGAIGKINEGKELSGSGSNFLGGWGRDVWGAEGWAVQKDIEQVVQRNLKAVLGAQFTQSEGDRLIQRAYDPTAEESVNLRRLQMLQRQMEIAAEQRSRASEYFNKNGTMVGFQGAMPTVQDFENAIDSAITDGPMQMRTDRGTETIPAQSWSAAPGGSARSSPTTPTAPMDWRAGPSPQARPVQQQRNALPPGVTPEMWAVMDDEDKAAFQ